MAGGQAPAKNTGPLPAAGPALTPRSAWPFTAGPVPPSPITGTGGGASTYANVSGLAGLPGVTLPDLGDMWQILLDGRLLAGRGADIGIVGYTGLGLPSQRTADMPLPNEHGVIALGDYHDSRTVTFDLCVNGGTDCVGNAGGAAASAWDALRYITGVWQARTANVLLEMRMTTGQTYVLIGRPRRCEADTDGLRRGYVAIAAEFVAVDPRLYDVELQQRTITLAGESDIQGTLCLASATPGPPGICVGVPPTGSGVCMINIPPLLNGQATIVNEGNTDSLPIVTFFGPATNPVITNLTTDRQLGITYDLAAGDQVQVDMRTRNVLLNGAVRYDLLATAADFWPLVPGENVVTLHQQGTATATATLIFRSAWL
jgi:Phage tail protein